MAYFVFAYSMSPQVFFYLNFNMSHLITCFLIEIIKREVCKYKMLKYTDCIEIHPKMCYDE